SAADAQNSTNPVTTANITSQTQLWEAYTGFGAPLTEIHEGTYSIFVRVAYPGGCFSIAEVKMDVKFFRVEANTKTAYICFDGVQDISVDLAALSQSMLISPTSGVTVTFHLSQNDAELPANAVSSTQLITDDGLCPAGTVINVKLKKTPVFAIADHYFCPYDDSVDIKPDFTGLNLVAYEWKNPAGETVSVTHELLGVNVTGIYSLKVTAANGCDFTASFNVKHYEVPVITQLVPNDWNQDGTFDQANEQYFTGSPTANARISINTSTGTDGKMATGKIAAPADALLGETRMRVIKQYNAAVVTGCAAVTYGQAEDYIVNVKAMTLPLCTTFTLPTDGATDVLPNPASITWAAASNASGYKVYMGTTSGGTDVANGVDVTTNSYNPILAANTQYFVKVVPYNILGTATGCAEISFTTGGIVYCAATHTTVNADRISNLTFANISNASAATTVTGGYEDFTTVIGKVEAGGSYPMTITVASGNANDKFETMSLAGTIPVTENWTKKEIEEQKPVTDFIKNILKNFTSEVEESETYDHISGNIKHLRTDFKAKIEKEDLGKLITELHPTPAVCGIPKAFCMNAIDDFEMHPRNFYAGYIKVETEETGPDNNTSVLKKKLKLSATAINLLKTLDKGSYTSPDILAGRIKQFPIEVLSFRPLD
ncbi:hypothetical protein OSTOST_13087, partial [Ostertagia ostertagi]